MNILFVRHAIAVDPAEFEGADDLLRPLTAEGRRKALKTFKALARFYATPELLVSSEATRARQTADMLAEVFPGAARDEIDVFNPGVTYAAFVRWLRSVNSKLERVAIIGHEPDISHLLAGIVAYGALNIEVKKAACIEVDCNRQGRGELRLLFPPWAAT